MPNQFNKTHITRAQWLINAIANHDSDECLMWPFGRHSADRPKHQRCGSCRFLGVQTHAHRAAFYVAYGRWPLPIGRHTCDTPLCINPRHVIEGTHADNVRDRVERGRTVVLKGESHYCVKLTEGNVREILGVYQQGIRQGGALSLAKKFHVSVATISDIGTRRTWRHISI